MLPTNYPVSQQVPLMTESSSFDFYHGLPPSPPKSTHNRGHDYYSPRSMSNHMFLMELEFGPGIVAQLKSKFAAASHSSSTMAIPTSPATIQGGRFEQRNSYHGPLSPPSKDIASSSKRSSTNMTATVSPRKVDSVLMHKSLMNDNVVIIDRGSSVKLNSGLSAELVNKSECIEGLVSQYKAIFEKDPQALSNAASSPQRKKRASRECLADINATSPPIIPYRNSISELSSPPHDVVDHKKSSEINQIIDSFSDNVLPQSPPQPPPRPLRKAQLANQTKANSPPQVSSRPVPPRRPPPLLPADANLISRNNNNPISPEEEIIRNIPSVSVETRNSIPKSPPKLPASSPPVTPEKRSPPVRPLSIPKKVESPKQKELVLPENDVEVVELSSLKKADQKEKGTPKSTLLIENNVQSQPGDSSSDEAKKVTEKEVKPAVKERMPRMTSLDSLQKGASHPSRLGVDPTMSDGDKVFFDSPTKRLSLDSKMPQVSNVAGVKEQDTKDEKENTAPAFRVALKKSSGYGMTTIMDTKSRPITATLQPALKIDDPALLTTLKDLGRTRNAAGSDDHDRIVELEMEILKIVVLGHNTPTGSRSSLKRPAAVNTRAHLRITFNDKAITTHEYPSEQSLVHLDDHPSPNSVLNLDAETEESDTDGMLPSGESQVPRREGDLLRKPTGLSSAGLSSYKPSTLAEFQLGLERPAYASSSSADAAADAASETAVKDAQTAPTTSSTTSFPPSQRQHEMNKMNNQQDNDRRAATDKSHQWCVQPNSDSQGKFSNTASNADDMLF
ncbi:hypothetical protein RvY_01381 [Ramazzottius varieornatus]|uniref:Uncharacterized protein n=1 Tax=Ramazzottius varieornatus TaxID=947166 RepID=A0A1D1UQU2_RAMVA|nr:hypothetical protein RvY_01381 [Ramazzottius varieornatus]